MRFPVRTVLVLALMCACIFGAAQLATAAPVDTSGARTAVQFWPEGEATTTVIIVTVELPDDTELPATVRMPLPIGAQVTWAGEIIGGDIENDVGRPFTIVDGEGGKSIELTLEETLTAQYDATYNPVIASRGEYEAILDWIQSEPTEDVQFNLRISGTVTDIVIDPAPAGEPDVNAFGERLYKLSPVALQPGESAALNVSYARPELAGDSSSNVPTLLPWLLGALGVAVIVLVVVVVSSARRRGGEDSGTTGS